MEKEYYELDLYDNSWVLFRHTEGSPIAMEIKEAQDINEIFLAMFKDKASRGKGNTVRIG